MSQAITYMYMISSLYVGDYIMWDVIDMICLCEREREGVKLWHIMLEREALD